MQVVGYRCVLRGHPPRRFELPRPRAPHAARFPRVRRARQTLIKTACRLSLGACFMMLFLPFLRSKRYAYGQHNTSTDPCAPWRHGRRPTAVRVNWFIGGSFIGGSRSQLPNTRLGPLVHMERVWRVACPSVSLRRAAQVGFPAALLAKLVLDGRTPADRRHRDTA
eukprot:scaffold16712_cov65-Phaeocystis_antarctica.AAC.25